MHVRGVFLGLLLGVVVSSQASALTVLCVETSSTGFIWKDGDWRQSNFTSDQYLIEDVGGDATLGAHCTPEPIRKDSSGSRSAKLCLNIEQVGNTRTFLRTTLCSVNYSKIDDNISSVWCNGAVENYSFEPTGRFVLSRTYSALINAPSSDFPRDSLVLSIGKCSLVTQ